MALVVLGLLLVLTYLLFRGATPDAELHERRLRAIDALTFNEAALHRDVLKASHGLLLDYDPLVATVARLRGVATEIRNAGAPHPLIDGIAAQLDRQEALVELSAQAVPDGLHEDTAALRAHGALILQNHPLVGGILARLLETRVSEQANSLQDHFMEQQRH